MEMQTLFRKSIIITLIILLVGCNATQPPSYQKDRSPEDRNEYNGLEGMVQQQKDQNYLMSTEIADKCSSAKIDLAIAEADKNTKESKKQKAIISDACI